MRESGNYNVLNINYRMIKTEIENLSNTFYQGCGLYRITPNYFYDYVDTAEDMKRWRDGFGFQLLRSIKENKEFRRTIVVEEIKSKLETSSRLLMLGVPGTSKTTILMEVICDYYDKGFEILWNQGSVIKEDVLIINHLEILLNDDNHILVAVDNVHDENKSAIFFIMDRIFLHKKSRNIRFLLTARLPDYDILANDRLVYVQNELHRVSLRKFREDSKSNQELKFHLQFFNVEETKQFVKKYLDITKQSLDNLAMTIHRATDGHPLMLTFYINRRGLRNDIEEKYIRYLYKNNQPDPLRIRSLLICSLYEIAVANN